MTQGSVVIRPFEGWMQDSVAELVLDGLAQRWGNRDASLNEDLSDIGSSYRHDVFLVALSDSGEIVGTGALRQVGPGHGEIVRMSVAPEHRRKGIGSLLLSALRSSAENRGIARFTLETTADWHDARTFYENAGFVLTHYTRGVGGIEAHYELEVAPARDSAS